MPTRQHILLTRPEADSVRMAGLIEQRGFMPVVAPMLAVRALHPSLPRRVQAVLVTSGNALEGVAGWGVKLLAVGDATAARAMAHGFTDVASASGDAADLVALARRTLRPCDGPLLLLSGAGQGAVVVAALRDAGFGVHRRVTYSAGPASEFPKQAVAALAADTLHAAIFLSAETAAAFVRLIPASSVHSVQGVLGLAIGKAAANALNSLQWRQVRLAAEPTLDGVLALI